jgi:hypothetical protein
LYEVSEIREFQSEKQGVSDTLFFCIGSRFKVNSTSRLFRKTGFHKTVISKSAQPIPQNKLARWQIGLIFRYNIQQIGFPKNGSNSGLSRVLLRLGVSENCR